MDYLPKPDNNETQYVAISGGPKATFVVVIEKARLPTRSTSARLSVGCAAQSNSSCRRRKGNRQAAGRRSRVR
ncbi:MAG: hypothetical protein M3082_16080 [Candidatus Dormibacteraeota bacterium]|nr:hypothetical protein [Candidatus Dormibacteraeota bacterium]